MSRTIIIDEGKISLLKESEGEVTFFKFFCELKRYIADLLSDPIHAKQSPFFAEHGIDAKTLRNKMIERGIIKRKEDINEPVDEDGNMESVYTVSYKVPKLNFKRNIRRMYQELFPQQ